MRAIRTAVPTALFLLLPCCALADSAQPSAGTPPETPPGAESRSPELTGSLQAALIAKGTGYLPRTHHLVESGAPRFTNRLILETSPYLIQHAHNPVDWRPWGDEAFEEARRLGRPVLLSVGYSTCHWCHVMERESFEDLEIARFINEHYVPIKVDREERPDVDAIYMNAVQLSIGRGGWPMTVWLTPDRVPFYGGTYFPARDGDRGSTYGFLTRLRELHRAYEADPQRANEAGQAMARRIRANLDPGTAARAFDPKVLDAAADYYDRSFDPEHGGLQRSPKFPSDVPVRFLLRNARRTGRERDLQIATVTLERMAAGGLHDQIGGGFHRYSTDGRWLVPHFEKMLYDNALLALAYTEAYQATGRDELAQVARKTLDYVAREMTAPGGGFYSATDADSPAPNGHDEEGLFFTWTPEEIRRVLKNEAQARLVERHYGVTAAGNFEGRSILHVARPLEQVARELNRPLAEVRGSLAAAQQSLYEHRGTRRPPLRDDKILAGWNGLMISAFAVGGDLLDEPDYLVRAERAARFVLETMIIDGRLRRSSMDGRAPSVGFLDDHAFLIAGLLDLHQANSDPHWLRAALDLQTSLDRFYADPRGGYFMTGSDQETLLAREKPAYDGAEPSGNSVAARNLLRLHALTTDDRFRAAAERLLGAFQPALDRAPAGLRELLLAVDLRRASTREIALVAPDSRDQLEPFLAAMRGRFDPHHVRVAAVEGADLERQAARVPWLAGKVARDGEVTAYVCRGGVCRWPATDVATFLEQLETEIDGDPNGAESPAETVPERQKP